MPGGISVFAGVLAYTLSNQWLPPELRAEEETMKRKALEFVDEFHNPDDLTTVFLAPSTLFLCTEPFLNSAGEQARRLDLGIQIHIAEIAGEVDDLLIETGRRSVEQLEHLDLLGERLCRGALCAPQHPGDGIAEGHRYERCALSKKQHETGGRGGTCDGHAPPGHPGECGHRWLRF